jgi:tRNA threonylcarbamoyladenosine biosynthesis protein TsaB
VLPVDTLWAVAESARLQLLATGWPPGMPLQVWACLDARMGEWYVAHYRYAVANAPDAECTAGPWLVNPQELWADKPHRPEDHTVYAGPVFEPDAQTALDLPPNAVRVPAWPTGTALLGLAPLGVARGNCVAPADAQPLYVRDQVALTTAERQAARLAKDSEVVER